MKIAYFGTDQFAAQLLGKLEGTGLEPNLVITKPDSKAKRGQKFCSLPVKKQAQKLDSSLLQPEKLDQDSFLETYKQNGIDLALVCDFGKIIPEKVLKVPQFGTLGVHPSLLPKYRGPTPIQTTILESETKTGVSLFVVDSKIDHGPILKKSELKITSPYFEELSSRLVQEAVQLLKTIVPKWKRGDIQAKLQDEKKATYTEQFSKEEGRINWRKENEKIERKIKALSTCLGVYTFFKYKNKKRRLKIFKAKVPQIELRKKQRSAEPGTIFNIDGKLLVKTKKDCLQLTEVQPENKDKMSGKDFLNGYQKVKTLITH